MRRLSILVILMATGGIALAQTATPPAATATHAAEAPTFVEAAAIDGGENARNGTGDGSGIEAAGLFGFAQGWYAGGALGRFEQDLPGGDIESRYLNLKGGRMFSVAARTNAYLEGGLWLGDVDTDGDDTDPKALELKTGFIHSVSQKLDFLGSLSWVTADLDTDTDDDLRNYVWSAGAAYNFTKMFSMNLRIIDGFNGVNGQEQVLRLAARWTF